jgi:16S rRNA (cytidine1402-2'-O)-methyltransferase
VGGFEGSSFLFQGFFPRGEKEALTLLDQADQTRITRNLVFFESPHRIKDTLLVLQSWCEEAGVDPACVFAKELTKLHEAVFRGRGAGFLKQLQEQGLDERGEWVFSLSLSKDCLIKKEAAPVWESALECLIAAGIAPKTASQIVTVRFSVARNLAYKRALEFQKK